MPEDGAVFDPTPPDLWRAARALDPSGHLEWTFSLFVHRSLAIETEVGPDTPSGLDLVYEPLRTWDDVLTVVALRDALLDAGTPETWVPQVGLGFEVFDSVYGAPGGRLRLPEPQERFRGGHSVGFIDIVSELELRFVNSWGGWGDDGAGYISRAYFEEHVDSVWVSRASWLGLSPALESALLEHSWRAGRPRHRTVTEIVDNWCAVPNRPFGKTVTTTGGTYEIHARSTYALRQPMRRLQIADVRSGEGVLGRVHVHHELANRVSTVEELFVKPDQRGRGVGSLLDDVAEDLAKRQGAKVLHLWLHEADADPFGEDRAEQFAVSRGYIWERRRVLTRPNIHGVGVRAL